MLQLIGIARAIVEMLGLCLLGQGLLHIIAGSRRAGNPIYRAFDIVTHPPRRLVAALMPGFGEKTVALCTFAVLFLLWIGLAFLRLHI